MSLRKDYNHPHPTQVFLLFRSQFSLTHIRENGRCTISSEQNCTTFYEFLKEPENDTKKLTQHNFLGKRRYDWMQIIKKKKHKQMARRLGRQIGDRRDNFSRPSFFLLAMATKTVAAWSAVRVVGTWNSLPLFIREATSVNSFKALAKKFFMDQHNP